MQREGHEMKRFVHNALSNFKHITLMFLFLAGSNACLAGIQQVSGGFLLSGNQYDVLISETNGAIVSLSAGGQSFVGSGDAGLWAVSLNTNDIHEPLATFHANQFATNNPTHLFSAEIAPDNESLWLTYTHTELEVAVTLSNRTDGVELSATLNAPSSTVFSINLPALLRFAPASLDRFIAPNHSSDGVGMAYNASYFEAQPENSPASWKQTIVGAGGYHNLFGGNLVFGDYVVTNLAFTSDGIAWLGAEVAATWSNATAVVHRPPAAGQSDIVLIDSPHGAFLSGSQLGGGPGAGYLMRIGGNIDASRVPMSLDVVVGAIEHLAANASAGRSKVALLSMIRGPMVGNSWPSEVRLDQWLARLQASSTLASGSIEVVELRTMPDIIDALTSSNFLAVLNPYGELLPASLSGGVLATVTNIGNFVRSGGHWFEVGGHPFFQALQPELYYENNLFYPPVFADFFQLEATAGNLAVYGVQPASPEPWAGATNPAAIFVPGQLQWGADTTGGWFQRSFNMFVPASQSWSTPPVRLSFNRTAPEALADYAEANDYHRGLDEKMDIQSLDRFKQSVLIHFKGAAQEMIDQLDHLPSPSVIHFEEYLKGGFDREYPDHLPPHPDFGTPADFTNFLAQAKAAGHLTMPYTNPTFWGVNPKGPTFLATNDAPLLLNLDGSINYEEYFGHGGFTVTPWHPAVQTATRHTRNQFITTYPVDLVFHDQLGARTWQYDLNPESPSAYAYLDGLINIAAEDSTYKGLSTENGYDRLINHEAQFCGLAWGLAPTTNAPFWRRYLRHRFAPSTWEIFPLAQYLAHDKLAFTYNNLDAAVHNHEVMAWTLGLGYNMTFVITPEDLAADTGRREWLKWIDRVQKSTVARYVGQGLTAFSHEHDADPFDEKNGIISASYGPVDIIANLDPQPLTTNGYTLAPYGYLATAPGMMTAYMIQPNGTDPVAYVVETNLTGGFDFWIHATGNTNVSLALPDGFSGDVMLEVEGGELTAAIISNNTISLELGTAPTTNAHLWSGIIHLGATRHYLIDAGRHDGLLNPALTNGFAVINPDTNGRYWNSIGPDTQDVPPGTRLDNLIDTTNGTSGISIEITSPGWSANGILNGGLLNPSQELLGELAVTNATMDYFFTTSNATFKLAGLRTNRTYDVTFFGTRETTSTRISAYSSGTNTISLQTSGTGIGAGGYNGNNNNSVTLSGLSPDPSGERSFTLSVDAGGFAYLGIISITEHIPVSELSASSNPLLAIFGSSVAKGWNSSGHTTYPNVFVDGGSWSNGYAALMTLLLAGQGGPAVTNVSTPGDNTAAGLSRFNTRVAPLTPDYVLLAYSLGNEGLAGSTGATSSNIVATFTSNLWQLVQLSRSNGITPVISSVYPHGNYTMENYQHLKQTHLTINTWDVPSLNLMTPIDNGAGQWMDGYWYDSAHPNDAGYAEFFYSFVPSLFDAIAAGKTNPPSFSPLANFARLSADAGVDSPLTFTPSHTMHSFTMSFRMRTSATTGTIAAVRSGTDYSSLELRDGTLVYIDRSGAQTVMTNLIHGNVWHDIALSSRYALSNTAIYVDGELAGSLPEQYEPDEFILGGAGASGRAATPASIDLQHWCIYRAGWTPDEVLAQRNGNLQQSSLEMAAMLDDTAFTNGTPVANIAQSLTTATVNTPQLTPQTASSNDPRKLLVFGSSVAKGWNGGGGITNGSYGLGYAGRLTPVIELMGWTVTNASIGGNDTTLALDRFDRDAVPEAPGVILIGLSLGNEGLLWDPPDQVFESFRSGMTNLIQRARMNGMYPVISLPYSHSLYNDTHFRYAKQMNLLINSWDVPSINLLGAVDDGAGRWATNYVADPAHPNVAGHEQIFQAIVPTLFEAIATGKTNTPNLAGTHDYVRLDGASSAPFTFTPANAMQSFNLFFRARASSTGTIAAVITATNGLPAGSSLALRDNAVVYIATNGTEIVTAHDNEAGAWVDIALSHSFVRGLTLLYVDGVLAGTTAEYLTPLRFTLGGPDGLSGYPPAPAGLDLQDWFIYRAPWNDDEALAHHYGALQQASLEIAAPLNDSSFQPGAPVSNRAQSLSEVAVSSTGLSPQAGATPPGSLSAISPSYNTVVLSWFDQSTTESGFVLQRRALGHGAPWTNIAMLAINSDAYTDSGIPGADYAYRVASLEGDLYSDFSSVVTVTVSNAPFVDRNIYYREWAARYFDLEAETYRIDLNTATNADYSGETWNTVTSLQPAPALSLISTGGFQPGISIAVTDAFSDFRAYNGSPLADYAATAQASYFGINNSGARLVLSNLSRLAVYDFSTFHRRSPAVTGYDYRTTVRLQGLFDAGSHEINAASNATLFNVFGLAPASTRDIIIDILPPAAATGTVFGGINFMDVREVPGRDTFLIDFNSEVSPVYPAGQYWNTIASNSDPAPYTLTDIFGSSDAGYALTLLDGFDQARADNGGVPGGFTDTAENTCFALRDDLPLIAVMSISGLSTNHSYSFTLLARRGALVAGFDYGGTYTFAGANTNVMTIESATNETYYTASGIIPDPAGNITLTISAGPAAGTDFPVINLMRMERGRMVSGSSLSSLPGDDPFATGIPNLIAYGMNLDPREATGHPLQLKLIGLGPENTLSVRHDRSALTPEMMIQPETTIRLVPPSWQFDPEVIATVIADDGTNQTIQLERSQGTNANLYLRLKAIFEP